MTPEWVHWSNDAALTLDERTPDLDDPYLVKPPGALWLSDEAQVPSWSSWCAGEEYPRGKHRYDVDIAHAARLVTLSSLDDILAFGREYACREGDRISRSLFLHWKAIALRHEVVAITPYVWDARFHPETAWYYGWDVASAVVLYPHAVGGIRRSDSVDLSGDGRSYSPSIYLGIERGR